MINKYNYLSLINPSYEGILRTTEKPFTKFQEYRPYFFGNNSVTIKPIKIFFKQLYFDREEIFMSCSE